MRPVLSPQAALIYVMVITSASDADMSDPELHAIGEIVKTLPAFTGFDPNNLLRVSQECAAVRLVDVYNGLFEQGVTIPAGSCPTVGVSGLTLGGGIGLIGRRWGLTSDRLRETLGLDRLVTAALERAARARFAKA